MNSELRKELIFQCENYVNAKLERIESSIQDLEHSLASETKSSAGDKFETGREMINIEINKLSHQKAQFGQLQQTIHRIPEKFSWQEARFGAIVKTNLNNYFLSIPAGELIVGKEKFFAVGISSPIAQAFMGQKEGDELVFNSKSSKIISVL